MHIFLFVIPEEIIGTSENVLSVLCIQLYNNSLIL